MTDYMTETHPAVAEFDIEGQEAEEAKKASEAAGTPEPTDPPTEPSGEPEKQPEKAEEPGEAEAPEDGDKPADEADPNKTAQEKIDDGDVNPDDVSDIVGPDGKYMTYREVAKGYKSLQSMSDKKLAEVNNNYQAAQKQLEEMQEWRKQQEYFQQQQQLSQITPEQWQQQIDLYPGDTLNWAAENAPDMVPAIISRVRETKGNQVADQMLVGYQQYVTAVNQQQAAQQAQIQQQPMVVQNNIATAMDAVTTKYGETFTEMQEDVSAAIQSGNYKIDFNDPGSIAGAVEMAYLSAFRQKAIEGKHNPATQQQATPPQAETGSPGVAQQNVSEEDKIADEIVDQFHANPYSR